MEYGVEQAGDGAEPAFRDLVLGRASAADNLIGLAGNDTLRGSLGDDKLEGGEGDDYLDGQAGNDTYVWSRGHGSDTIYDTPSTATDTDTLVFTDVASDEVTLRRKGNGIDIIIETTAAGEGGVIYDTNTFHSPGTGYGIERMVFSDGVVWDQEQIFGQTILEGTTLSQTLNGSNKAPDVIHGLAGNDVLNGYLENDTLYGGTGDDRLWGGGGRDVFQFTPSDGTDTITDFTFSEDTLQFIDTGLGLNDLQFQQVGTTAYVYYGAETIFLSGRNIGEFTAKNFSFVETGTPITIVNTGATRAGDTGGIDLVGPNVANATNHSNYTQTDIGADWVWGGNIETVNSAEFTFEFDLTGYDLTTAVLSGQWAVDNTGTISLNGHEIESGSGFGSIMGYETDVDAYFVQGINTVTYSMVDTGSVAGFKANAQVTARPTTAPEDVTQEPIPDALSFNDITWWHDDTDDGIEHTDDIYHITPEELTGHGDLVPGSGTGTLEFTYQDDLFRGTNNPDYAYEVDYGEGTYAVQLGGLNNAPIVGMSAGYTTQFTVAKDTKLYLDFDATIYGRPYLDNPDYIESLIALDGVLIETNGTDYLERDYDGAGARPAKHFTIELDVTAGTHTLDIGGFMNAKNDTQEWSQARFSNVVIRQFDHTTISDEGGTNTLQVHSSIAAEDLIFETIDDDLQIRFGQGGDMITLEDQWSDYFELTVSTLELQNGDVIDLRDHHLLAGNDVVTGTAYREQLFGWGGNDALYGYAGNDYFHGGEGDDTLWGGTNNTANNGNDTYVWSKGDGNDVISDWSRSLTETDTLRLLDVTSDDVSLTRTSGNNDQVLTVLSTGETITLDERYQNVAYGYGVEFIEFSDGVTWDVEDLLERTRVEGTAAAETLLGKSLDDNVFGLDGNDTIYTYAGDDTLTGGTGDDHLWGGTNNTADNGNDTYIWSKGDGNDFIYDWSRSLTENDVLRLTDVTSDDVTLHRVSGNSDQVLTVLSTGETITLDERYQNVAYRYGVEAIEFADGVVWNEQELLDRTRVEGDQGNNALVGKNLNDNLFGFEGNDTLTGNAGNDLIVGGAGNDSLNGGAGQDTFRFRAGDGNDTIGDFDINSDILEIMGPGLTKDSLEIISSGTQLQIYYGSDSVTLTGNIANLTDENFLVSGDQAAVGSIDAMGSAGDDTLLGGSADDTLTGNAGNDYLYGDDSDDEIFAGVGNDLARGGRGNDTYLFEAGDGQLTIEEAMFRHPDGTVVLGSDDYSVAYIKGSPMWTHVATGEIVQMVGTGVDTLAFGDDIRISETVFTKVSTPPSTGEFDPSFAFGEMHIAFLDENEEVSSEDLIVIKNQGSAGFSGSGFNVDYFSFSTMTVGGSNSFYNPTINLGLTGTGQNDVLQSSATVWTSSWLSGLGGDDVLRGAGHGVGDIFNGGSGNDTINPNFNGVAAVSDPTLRDGDIFIFNEDDGQDVITFFDPNIDLIVIDIAQMTYDDLTIESATGGVQVTYDQDDTILLQGVEVVDISEDNFAFG